MARANPDVDYRANLKTMRDTYATASPDQRLSVIRQRLEDHNFGPNRLPLAVSAVEGFARSLAMHLRVKSKMELAKLYGAYRDRRPESLVEEILTLVGVTNIDAYFGEDTWRLFGYAVEYRNLVVHECTYLGIDKFPSLIEACEEILTKLESVAKAQTS
jgi:hypothetical protein